jgi:hypothetical protein
VLGEGALDWFADRNLAARFVAQDGTVTAVGSWPRPELLAVAS